MIGFHFESVSPIPLEHLSEWLEKTIENEGKTAGEINIILGTDDWLLEINQQYLNHDFYTDVITFDYCENNVISGDVFISLERVTENAKQYNVSRETELNRVVLHGILHLCGYGDATVEQQKKMREKEDFYLNLL